MADPEDFFSKYLVARYPVVKAQYPLEGRRKWRLRVIDQFWALPVDAKQAAYAQSATQAEIDDDSDFLTDKDILDEIADDDAPGLGILVRTDFSNEEAWLAFCEKLKEAEQEFSSLDEEQKMDEDGTSEAQTQEGDEDEEYPDYSPIITVINAPLGTRGLFSNISNLTALRLLNDVGLKPVTLPPNTKRTNQQNKLIDLHGWQETYHGKTIWIYDQKSTLDQCVRLVSPEPDFYGTATGDSWRARVTHICELQVNMSSAAMKIDFGGMDRYDYEERVRNLQQSSE